MIKNEFNKTNTVDRYSLLLMGCGVAVNFLGVRLALFFELPLFLDSIGTVLAAALGGTLPGIVVGFFSNLINGFSDPITLYYGIVSILIGLSAAFFSRRGLFRTVRGCLLAALTFALIGGGFGSLLTWLLYGFNFGTGVSAPYALLLHERIGMSRFWAQFTADLLIDLADKLVTVTVAALALRVLPDGLCSRFALGRGFVSRTDAPPERKLYRRWSLQNEVVFIIVATAVLLGTLATTIGFVLYKNTMEDRYVESAQAATELAARTLDADALQGYLDGGTETDAYLADERALKELRDALGNIEYLYVYQIRADGCHVIFDVDTDDTAGGMLGDIVPIESAFEVKLDTLLAGGELDPVISNGAYGWLLTVYRPLRASDGTCVAYAAADIRMDAVIADRYVYIIRMVSLLFGAAIVMVVLTLLLADKRVVAPVNAMTAAAGAFAYDSEQQRLAGVEQFRQLGIVTGDELESLYRSLTKMMEDTGHYIGDIREQAAVIAAMRDGMLLSFAEMVESRDENTGEHVLHTAGYVRIIAEKLRADGRFPELLTEEYIEELTRSAPLHDIGKIQISDVLLNKPGRLTPEEFAVMQTHTTAGRVILETTMKNIHDDRYLAVARDMAAYHHERWDGKGYPEGLRGEAIPLCARIMAVADVFDALISRRSYKDAMAYDAAFRVIAEESGTHFDPVVAEAFLSSKERVAALACRATVTAAVGK